MKTLSQVIIPLLLISFVSCTSPLDMPIDAHLKENSIRFDIDSRQESADQLISFGHFSSYQKEFGTLWMERAGIAAYFNSGMQTFAAENNDNYVYDIVVSEIQQSADILKFAEQFKLPLENLEKFESALVGYLYAAHDEYAMIYIKESPASYTGFLSNGFDLYEIIPVLAENEELSDTKDPLLGFQFKLNNEFVGSLQLKGKQNFRMTNEYCDATEMILGAIASIMLKFENL